MVLPCFANWNLRMINSNRLSHVFKRYLFSHFIFLFLKSFVCYLTVRMTYMYACVCIYTFAHARASVWVCTFFSKTEETIILIRGWYLLNLIRSESLILQEPQLCCGSHPSRTWHAVVSRPWWNIDLCPTACHLELSTHFKSLETECR